MDSNKSTAVFEIPRLTAKQGGLWECRVSTNGGQDSRKFNLTVKGGVKYLQTHIAATKIGNLSEIIFCVYTEPPVPSTPPKLLEKRSKQLLVMPTDSYRGDGPIISTRLLYKPVESDNAWSSIIGRMTEIAETKAETNK